MKIERVGVMSPGDMGQAVSVQLKAKGFNVCTGLASVRNLEGGRPPQRAALAEGG